MINVANHFLNTIHHLRSEERIVLFSNKMTISSAEKIEVADYLELEFTNECLNYPYIPPQWDEAAAIWAAEFVFFTANLYLFRDESVQKLQTKLSPYNGSKSASAMLSADLTLRFLPFLLINLRTLDAADPIIIWIEQVLQDFHYSGIGYIENPQLNNLSELLKDNCFSQLYVNRVQKRKAIIFAQNEIIAQKLSADMGDYQQNFWKELYIKSTNG